jgi:hypothetical protein
MIESNEAIRKRVKQHCHHFEQVNLSFDNATENLPLDLPIDKQELLNQGVGFHRCR